MSLFLHDAGRVLRSFQGFEENNVGSKKISWSRSKTEFTMRESKSKFTLPNSLK
jgi:hypothetical protein